MRSTSASLAERSLSPASIARIPRGGPRRREQNKVVVAGSTFTSSEDFYVRRYNADGSPDMSFNGGNIVTIEPPALAGPATNGSDFARAVLVLSDSSIIVGGSSHSDDTGSDQFAIVQFSANGRAALRRLPGFRR